MFLSILFFWIFWGICSYFTYLFAENQNLTKSPPHSNSMGLTDRIIYNLQTDENDRPVLRIAVFFFLTPMGIIFAFLFPIVGLIVN